MVMILVLSNMTLHSL